MRNRLAVLLGVCALALGAVGGIAFGESQQIGNLILTVDGGFSPKKLPKNRMAPIKLKTEGHIRTDDGSTPPITDRVVVDFDRNGDLFTKGLPQCDPRKLENTLTKQALKKCKPALVGRGRTNGIIDFPDQEPFEASGPLLAFNGTPQGGKPRIVFHVFAHVPLPTTFVVPAVISKAPGRKFGRRVTVNVPPISGGNGTLVDYNLTVNRRWKFKGKKVSYLNARCKNGRFVANAHVTTRDNREFDIGIVRRCKAKGKRGGKRKGARRGKRGR